MKNKFAVSLILTILLVVLLTVTVACDGGREYKVELVDEGVTLYLKSGQKYDLPIPTKEGYTFKGWHEGETKFENSGKWSVRRDVTLTASWSANRYTVTFNTGMDEKISSQQVTYGSNYIFGIPFRNGYEFGGWYYGAQALGTFGTWRIASDVVVTARWTLATVEGLQFTQVSNGYVLTGYTGDKTDIIVPSFYKNGAVVGIGEYAFIASNVTYVGIPHSVKYIEDSAFLGCFDLTEVYIPDSVNSIGNGAFSGCYNLEKVEIPSSVRSLGTGIFRNCGDIEISVNEDNYFYYSVDNCVIERQTGTLVLACNKSVIPTDGSITAIGNSAFSGCDDITSIDIPSSVTTIGTYAFGRCISLESIYIPSNVKSIGDSAFYECESLADIDIESEDTYVAQDAFFNTAFFNNPENWQDGALYICNRLVDINSDLPENFTVKEGTIYIGQRVFEGNTRLVSVTIPDSVKFIDDRAFMMCENLETVNLPSNLQVIGESAFSLCFSLKSIDLPEGLKEIDDAAFYACTSITEVTIPSTVTKLGTSTFAGSGIGTIQVADGNSIYFSQDNCVVEKASKTLVMALGDFTLPTDGSVTAIGDFAFCANKNIVSYTIPEFITSIGINIFSGCDNLQTITVDAGNKYYHSSGNCIIETATKRLVAGIANSVIPTDGSVKIIGAYSFSGIDALTSFVIPDSVESIESKAFSSCFYLTSITIGSGVTSIGEGAFDFIRSLEDVYYRGSEQDWNKISIGSYNDDLLEANIHFDYNG